MGVIDGNLGIYGSRYKTMICSRSSTIQNTVSKQTRAFATKPIANETRWNFERFGVVLIPFNERNASMYAEKEINFIYGMFPDIKLKTRLFC